MILTMDVGNSQIFAGVFVNGVLKFRFRKSCRIQHSSDEFGLFLIHVLRENGFDPKSIQHIVMSSVVPEVNHSLSSACIKYFQLRPLILQAGLKTGLKIKYRNPLEVGSDRIANCIGAAAMLPEQNVIIADFGTATTVCVLSKQKEYLGGIIAPGLRLSMETLEKNTAKLPTVEIVIPQSVVGRSTIENIQSGIYFSALGLVREVIQRVQQENFAGEPVTIVATGGFSGLFESEGLFNFIESDLVLLGLFELLKLNVDIAQ